MIDDKRYHWHDEEIWILDLNARNNGRTCETEYCCGGEVSKLDSNVRLRKVQV